jgi:hypothetical protein
LGFAVAPLVPVRADDPAASPEDDNPRNVRFAGAVVERVSARPRAVVRETGDRAEWDEGTVVRFTATLRHLGGGDVPARAAWTVDGASIAANRDVLAPRVAPFRTEESVRWEAEPGRHEVAVLWGGDRCAVETDALRILLLVERKTFEAGEARFGSFVRRFRRSLEDLHALFEASRHPLAPRGLLDRFRVDEVVVYDRKEGERPPGFDDHPEFDLAIACDEGGPLAGFHLPAHSIGHNFLSPEGRGLWSAHGEQALWHEILHFRGVQDFYLSEISDGALPDRWKGTLPLPERFAKDLMRSPYQAPHLSEYTAVMANVRRGVARVGACEDTENRYGHVWNYLPGRVDLFLTRGAAPLPRATVRWWRSRKALDLLEGKAQGVAVGRAPDGEAVTDERGRVTIGGDYLGRSRPRDDRSLWLLVETEVEGARRFEILYGLDLNLAYARGDKYGTALLWRWEDLLVPGGTLPPGR